MTHFMYLFQKATPSRKWYNKSVNKVKKGTYGYLLIRAIYGEHICRICLGNVVNVSSDDMKNDGTSEKFLVKQDQTDSEDEEDTIPGLHSGFLL